MQRRNPSLSLWVLMGAMVLILLALLWLGLGVPLAQAQSGVDGRSDTAPLQGLAATSTPSVGQVIVVVTLIAPTPIPTEPATLSLAKAPPLNTAVRAGGKPADILSQASLDIENLWPVIVKRELMYRQMTGGKFYYQGLPTSEYPPKDGDSPLPDSWWRNPTDQWFGWQHIKIVDLQGLPWQLRIDTYDGPCGPGFVATWRLELEGATWQRSEQEGCEVFRAHGWIEIEAPK